MLTVKDWPYKATPRLARPSSGTDSGTCTPHAARRLLVR